MSLGGKRMQLLDLNGMVHLSDSRQPPLLDHLEDAHTHTHTLTHSSVALCRCKAFSLLDKSNYNTPLANLLGWRLK